MKHIILAVTFFFCFVNSFLLAQNDFYGDSVQVTHSQGNGEGNVYVIVDDPTQVTGDDYEVFFNKQRYYRNEDGEWIPIPEGKQSNPKEGIDTLTGSSIDIGAVYGPAAGVIELRCYLDLVSSNFAWADGITLTFPTGITIIDAPSFEAGGGTVTPVINGSTLEMGLINHQYTQNGIFQGGEEWKVLISSFTPPLDIDWVIFDDGYLGGPLDAEGTTTIDSIGYAFKTEDHWNVINLTTQDTVLEDQTVIMGYDLYTGEYVGDPITEGFKISVDVSYEIPTSLGNVKVNGANLTYSEPNVWWFNDDFIVCDFSRFGYPNGTASASLTLYGGAGGTSELKLLQQDYEFRWTGILSDTVINGNTLTITSSGGSIVTLFGASGYSLANHPLNPNPGVDQPFTLRVPFELWNKDENKKVNAVFWDRSGDPTINGSAVWNQNDREYLWIINNKYSPNLIDINSQLVADSATWNVIFYESNFAINDLVEIYYLGPVTSEDKFTFTTPAPISTVDDNSVPDRFSLSQNYPNPFNPSTTIQFNLPEKSLVKLGIYNILGEKISQLVNSELSAGTHQIILDGGKIPSGVYFYVLQVKDKFLEVKKMILLK